MQDAEVAQEAVAVEEDRVPDLVPPKEGDDKKHSSIDDVD